MYERLLVPVDGSKTSTQGLEEGIKLARQLKASIRLIHVLDDVVPEPEGAPSLATARDSKKRRAEADAILSDGTARASRSGVEVDSVLVETTGSPTGKYIVDYAKECRADLIVCGTHGRRGLVRLVMGSDAEYVVRHAPVPVLLVRG
jgi:nucleotide-binding universal stress UspA family protein